MTTLGFICPGRAAEDDYPRIEQMLGGGVRVDLVHTDTGEDTGDVEALRLMAAPGRLDAAVEQLRLSGVEAIVWACAGGGFVHGWQGAHDQAGALARSAGIPASSTSLGFAHAVGEVGAARVAVGAGYPDDVAALFAGFLRAGGIEVTSVRGSGGITGAETGAWGEAELLALARAADTPDADAVLLPDTTLLAAAHLPALEEALGKPVLTAGQVTVWEALRLTGRRVNAPGLGALFTREPIVQA